MKFLTSLALFTLAAALLPLHAVTISEKEGRVSIENKSLRLTYDLKSGRYSGIDLTSGLTAFSEASFTIDTAGWKQAKGTTRKWSTENLQDDFGKGKKLTLIEIPNSGYRPIKQLHLSIYDKQPFAVLGFSVENQQSFPVRSTNIQILGKAQFYPGKKFENPQVLRGGAGAEPNFVEPTLKISTYNSLLATGKIEGKRRSLVVGGLQYRDFFRRISLDPKSLNVSIEDPQGKLVAAGKTYHSPDSVFIDFISTNPFTSLERFGMAMRSTNNAQPNVYDFPTLCGGLVSTDRFGEGKPLNDSKNLVDQMEIANKSGILNYTKVAVRLEPDFYCYDDYGNTQQGWWDDAHWAKYKSLVPPYETFGKFCEQVEKLGGIPFTYFQSNLPSNDFAVAHPDWMLNNDISRLHAEHPHHMPFVKYDYTDPGFRAHTLKMWQRLVDEGMLGIKFDYPESSWCKDGGFEDKSHSTTSAYRETFGLARQGLGKDVFLHERNLGEYNTPRLDVTAGIVDLQRVWADSSHFEPEMTSRIGLRWFKNRSVFGYYPDGKSFKDPKTGKPHTTDDRRTMLTQVGLIAGRIELGTSFGSMTPEMQHDLTRLFPALGGTKSFRPVDMLVKNRKHPSVYVYEVNSEWSQIILSNNSEKANTLTVPLSGDQTETGSLGLKADKSYFLYDFWNDKFLGKFKGDESILRPLKAKQALSYSAHEIKPHPQFLSTNRHIMQGFMDLKNVKWDVKTKTLSGIAKVVGGEDFVLTLANNGHSTSRLKVDGAEATIATTEHGLTRLTLSTQANAEVKWAVSF